MRLDNETAVKFEGWYDRDLSRVTTPGEVAMLWEKSKSSVRRAISEGHLHAIRVHGRWLIAVESVYDLWGNPVHQRRPGDSTNVRESDLTDYVSF